MADDRLRATWRRHFSLMLHPHASVLQSLIEADDKINAAVGFLGPLSPDIEAEREQGMVVASVAIEYGGKPGVSSIFLASRHLIPAEWRRWDAHSDLMTMA